MSDPRIQSLASKHARTPGQILLRWAIQKNYIVLPKSVHQERVVENADVFGFVLDRGDMEVLDSCDQGGNVGWDPTVWK